MASENEICRSLASRLDMLEGGLKLADRETRLANPDGAGGRIDILARDGSNNLVVIEVKRHDQPARQAIHELFKYVRLLRTRLGVPQHRIRCFLVSTTWHELLVPFSELSRTEGYDVVGYEITVNQMGEVLTAKQVRPLAEGSDELLFDPEHTFLLFKSAEQRSRLLQNLTNLLAPYSFADFVALVVDHTRCRANIFPYGIYLAVSQIPESLRDEVWAVLSDDHPAKAPDCCDPWTLASMISSEFYSAASTFCDDCDNASPRVVAEILNEWKVVKTVRVGDRVSNESVFTDNDLLQRLGDWDGRNRTLFWATVSPRHRKAWTHNREALAKFLGGRHPWREPVLCWLDGMAANLETTISVMVFDAMNILRCLHPSMHADNTAPMLEIVADDGRTVRALFGCLEWDGVRRELDPRARFGNIISPFIMRTFANLDDWTWHGLSASLFERDLAGDAVLFRIETANGAVRRTPVETEVIGISQFMDAHRDYIDALARFIPYVSLNLDFAPTGSIARHDDLTPNA